MSANHPTGSPRGRRRSPQQRSLRVPPHRPAERSRRPSSSRSSRSRREARADRAGALRPPRLGGETKSVPGSSLRMCTAPRTQSGSRGAREPSLRQGHAAPWPGPSAQRWPGRAVGANLASVRCRSSLSRQWHSIGWVGWWVRLAWLSPPWVVRVVHSAGATRSMAGQLVPVPAWHQPPPSPRLLSRRGRGRPPPRRRHRLAPPHPTRSARRSVRARDAAQPSKSA